MNLSYLFPTELFVATLMLSVVLFGEDYAHQQVISPLVERIAGELELSVTLDWKSAVRGHGRVVQELHNYLRDLANQGGPYPDAIIVATDANCKGLNGRTREFQTISVPTNLVYAIPDPHIERWLLLDGAAFSEVFGKGCDAPDQKCDRNRYKQFLVKAIYDAGHEPIVGGLERASDLVQAMDIDRAAQADTSLERFVTDLRRSFRNSQL